MDRDKQVNNFEISNVTVYEVDMEKLVGSLVDVLDKEGAKIKEEDKEEAEYDDNDFMSLVSNIFGSSNQD